MTRKLAPQFSVLMAVTLTVAGPSLSQQPVRTDAAPKRVALDGDCAVSLVEMNAYVKGEERFSSAYRGLHYRFLSEEEKLVFDANPESFAVAFNGVDIVATYGLDGPFSGEMKINGSGLNSHRHENRKYHFADDRNVRLFVKQPSAYIGRAKNAFCLETEKKRGKTLVELYPKS